MIKFRAGELIGFGLSAENVKRLQAGEPIRFSLAEMGLPGEVLIFYGETEEAMAEWLKPHMGEGSRIHETAKYKQSKKH